MSGRIALIHYTAPPVVGGVERIVGRHAGLMADAGHSVRIVAGRGESADPRVRFERVELADTLHPAIVEVAAELAAGQVTAEFRALVARLEKELERALDGIQVAVLHNVASLNKNLPLTAALHSLAGRAEAPRLILWHHDLAWTMPRYRLALHDGAPWSLLRTPWPGATQVTISESRRASLAGLMRLPEESIAVVPGGVDLPDEAASGARAAAASGARAVGASGAPAAGAGEAPNAGEAGGHEGRNGFEPLLITPARVTPRKNVELAVEAVAALRAMGHPAGLIVTGPVDPHDATERTYLERLQWLRERLELNEAVVFRAETAAGPPSDEELDRLYRRADVMLIPSWDEGFGLPVLEAAVRDLPIVCSDLASLRELAGDQATYVSPNADGVTAAEAVLAAVGRGPSSALAERVRTRHSWPAIYERSIAPLLEKALSGGRRRH